MKTALWIVFGLVALVWTGIAALAAEVIAWAGQGLSAAPSDTLGEAAAALALPAWLSPWVDAATWNAWVQGIAGAVAALEQAFPALGEAVSWLVPAVWVGWGLGLAALLVLTFVGHWGLGRFGGRLPVRLSGGMFR